LENDIESRHFMDDERQITITIDAQSWISIEILANKLAHIEGWLGGKGSNWHYLNIWVLGRLAKCPANVDKNDWIYQAIE